MNTIETRIDAMCAVLEEGLSKLQLKCPSDHNATEVAYASPFVYPVYLPQGGALTGEHFRKAPSITVMPGAVTEKQGTGSLTATLALVTWDPGTRQGGNLTNLNTDGWRSLASLIDNTLRTLRAAGHVGGMRLLDDARAGLYDSRNTDLRPYYVGWLEVRFAYAYGTVSQDVLDLLN